MIYKNIFRVINVEPTVRFSVFRAFLQYLYTDKIDLPAEEAVG